MEENEIAAPAFAGGAALRIGDKVKLADGRLMRATTVAFTAGGVFVSDKPLADGERGFVYVGRELVDPNEDSLEEIEADAGLAPKDYCAKRAVADAEGLSKQQLMTRDLLERQAAVLTRP